MPTRAAQRVSPHLCPPHLGVCPADRASPPRPSPGQSRLAWVTDRRTERGVSVTLPELKNGGAAGFQVPQIIEHKRPLTPHPLTHSLISSVINHSFSHSIIHSLINSFIHSLIYSLTHPFVHSFICSLIHSFICSLIHSFICSLIH